MRETSNPFFVGYLPLSTPLKRCMWTVSGVAVSIILAAAVVISSLQSDPGVAAAEANVTPKSSEALIQVGEGKRGLPADRIAKQGADGTLYRRGTLSVFEPRELAIGGPSAVNAQVDRNALDVVLNGEIIDPKCYAGAMKPGDGTTHKSCAALCILGGIPPMLLVRSDDEGEKTYRLLDQEGRPFAGEDLKRIASLVGVPVSVQGKRFAAGPEEIIAARLEGIQAR